MDDKHPEAIREDMRQTHYTEDTLVQQTTADYLRDVLGWESVYAYNQETFGPDGLLGRESDREVVLTRSLREKLEEFNPGLPEDAYGDAVRQIRETSASQTALAINRDKYALLKDGFQVSFRNHKGELKKERLRVFNFEEPEKNHFLCVRELWVRGDLYRRRADLVGFVNGVPLLFIECKNVHKDLEAAYRRNLSDYLDTIPHLFHHNALVVLGNGIAAKLGAISSKFDHFSEWKRLAEEEPGVVAMEKLLKGVCGKRNFMDLFENFIVFDESSGRPTKIVARNHQFLGVATTELNERVAAKLEEFETDDIDVQQRLEKELKRDYHIITAKKRLDQVARDFVKHYATAWESGKVMVVCIDKLTCARMHELIKKHWQMRIKALEAELADAPDEQEEIYRRPQLAWMRETQMAVVVSEEQGEVEKFRKWELDIRPHRRLLKEGFTIPELLRKRPEFQGIQRLDPDSAFKEAEHPFRIAIVCAMWLTGFDVPSLATVYLDKPLKAHTLMQAIARRLQRLLERNPLRTDFQKHYEEIVAAYNREKDRVTIEQTFEALLKFVQDLDEEEDRAMREELDEESLAIFDLLKKPELKPPEYKRIKEVAVALLETLKAEKLKIDHWRDKESSRDALRIAIRDFLWNDETGLPVEAYSEDDVTIRTEDVFRHVYRVYPTLPSPYYAAAA